LRASRQALSDSAALQRYLDVRLPWGLNLRLENAIINGDGSAGCPCSVSHPAADLVWRRRPRPM